MFQNSHLSVEAKQTVYHDVVMAVLLCGTGTWIIEAEYVKRKRYKVTRHQQWDKHITEGNTKWFSMGETLADTVMTHCQVGLDTSDQNRWPQL